MSKDPYWLNRIMDLGHVIRVNPDGTIDEHPARSHPGTPYAPESVMMTDHDGQIRDGDEEDWIRRVRDAGWEPERGWTGQYGYSGPVMHASEFVGGALADHVAETPGLWVAVEVSCLPDEAPDKNDEDHDPEDCETCERSDAGDYEPAGWAILHMDDSPDSESYAVTSAPGPLRRDRIKVLTHMTLDAARNLARQPRMGGRIVRVTDLAVMPGEPTPAERLEAIRAALRAENISYGELAELQSLAAHIKPGDTELLEAAGVPEHEGS